jgi:hypothetical protein
VSFAVARPGIKSFNFVNQNPLHLNGAVDDGYRCRERIHSFHFGCGRVNKVAGDGETKPLDSFPADKLTRVITDGGNRGKGVATAAAT